jgi:hypothetical protein
MYLRSLTCPSCERPIAGIECVGRLRAARQFGDCLRRCETCGIGASNAAVGATYIHREPLENIPVESREGAREALDQALNKRNRRSKWVRFGYSTSEDAVTCVVFTELLRSGQLLSALRQVGVISEETMTALPTLLLWGAPVPRSARGALIQRQLGDACGGLQEDEDSFSEPDVIIDLADAGLIIVEVKHRSGNDFKQAEYSGWERYSSALGLRAQKVIESGCYELARNWCLLRELAGGRPATLVLLGPEKLFRETKEGNLSCFALALSADDGSPLVQVTWSDFLGGCLAHAPAWLAKFCKERPLRSDVGQ